MKRPDQDKLLQEMLTGNELSDFRQASLESGLALMRKRRRFRHRARLGAVVALMLTGAVGIVHHRKNEPPVRQVATSKPTTASPALEAASPEVKTISDEELFALFPGRSMVLIGKPGGQELVFLDGQSAQTKIH